MPTTLQIDTSNITNAFVSGMKEDLHLYGNEYNYIVVSWTIGYIIGQLVSLFPIAILLFVQLTLTAATYSHQTLS